MRVTGQSDVAVLRVRAGGASRQVRTYRPSRVNWSSGAAVTVRTDGWIRWTTIGGVAFLALIAGTVD